MLQGDIHFRRYIKIKCLFVWTSWVTNPCDLIDLKTKKHFFISLDDDGLQQDFFDHLQYEKTPFPLVLPQIRFSHSSWNLLSQKLAWNEKSSKPNLKAAIIHNQIYHCVNDWSKVKVHELVRSLLKFSCLNLDFSDHTDPQVTDLRFYTNIQTFNL